MAKMLLKFSELMAKMLLKFSEHYGKDAVEVF
jgi:hypothetical protein